MFLISIPKFCVTISCIQSFRTKLLFTYEVSFSLANVKIPSCTNNQASPAVQTTKLLGGVGLTLPQPIQLLLSAAAGCCSWIGWFRITPALTIGWCRFKPTPTNPVAAIAKCLFSPSCIQELL